MRPGESITEEDCFDEVVDEYGNLKGRIRIGTKYVLWYYGTVIKTWFEPAA